MESVSQSPASIENQKSAFDELLIAEPQPIISMGFPYNINTDLVITRTNGSGTVAQTGVSAAVKTAAGTSSFAQLLTRRTVKYNPGQGTLIRFPLQPGEQHTITITSAASVDVVASMEWEELF